MTSFRIERVPFTSEAVRNLRLLDAKFTNWPAVYTLGDSRKVYVGESLNVSARLRQHLDSAERRVLSTARVVIDPTFNKSVCLDLESTLIRLLAGDGQFEVINRNDGITNADYFDRGKYNTVFREIFERLREEGVFSRSIEEIENSDLFKLSPFKALSPEQSVIVEDILEGLFDDLANGRSSRIVIQGDPGTGKTVVAIYLMKLLSDIQNAIGGEAPEGDSLLADFFVQGFPELLTGFRMALVVPQQSLRKSVKMVFRKTPGLNPKQVLSPFEVVSAGHQFHLLVVDEAHRLNQRAAQAAGPLNSMFPSNNIKLFGHDDVRYTQFDWINAVSRHQLYMVDGGQAVRPADVSPQVLEALLGEARRGQRFYRLQSQMRVRAGQDYVAHVRATLDGTARGPARFDGYDLRFFDNLSVMRNAISAREREYGLARLLAGYAWGWASKNDKTVVDFVIDGEQLRWNSTAVDWVSSPGSADEVGSIHTIQGYDLNYAGVIIGPDLRFDTDTERIVLDRKSYRDPRGMTNNKFHGITYSDEDILVFVRNIYSVLLTRGMLGTYVYVCDPALRAHLRRFF
ncbi:DUF2075 domain-containing protein [Nocardioides sp. Leaf307]|uniref:DUF2075 domain-containing protein n=1 Tax=Nocardioides sp. Leaf307 TaxID=1736331 RepID=UPI000702A01B|nr:DUF2075 domain-containing protein [Nocardioides sp. Leaf307]KQQ39295.1 AAA family ATPase [Nocardioides sp. Leaf307]